MTDLLQFSAVETLISSSVLGKENMEIYDTRLNLKGVLFEVKDRPEDSTRQFLLAPRTRQCVNYLYLLLLLFFASSFCAEDFNDSLLLSIK